MTKTLRLTLLGGLRIAHGEAELEEAGTENLDGVYPERNSGAKYRPVEGFVSRKAQALLVYLAVTGRAHFRDALAGLLWGESSEERAAGNLRVVLSNLRRLVPDHVIITRRTVEFNRESDCWIDVVEFEGKLQEVRGRERADTSCVLQLAIYLRLYQGDFLEGFYVRGAPAFEEWLLVERERLRQMALQSLHCLVQHHVARGEYVAGIECVTRLLALDPWREEAHRELMRLLALSGQRSAALAQYEKCRRLLDVELGLEPLKETTALYQWLVDWETGRLADWETGKLVDRVISLPFKGRGDEHAQLVAWWEAVLRRDSRQARLALVEGEAGIGKTRLVEEAARYAEAQGAVVLRGRCYEFGGSVPYQPIAEALRTQIANNKLRIANLGDVWLAELARLAPEVREMRPDLPAPMRGSGEAARQRLFEAVFRFLKQVVSGASCLWFLDDLHWADQSTLDLLHYLVRQLSGAPVWIVGTYRPEEMSLSHPLTRLRQGLSRDHLVSRLLLGPLSSETMEEIACSLVGEEDGAAFGALLYQESEGNPFILVETVNDLQEQGVLQEGEGETWHWSGPPAAQVLPVSVRDVVLQRVGRLSEPAQRLLTLAAVIGRQFDGPLLQAAAGRDADAVNASLDEWLTRRLVRQYPAASIQHPVSSIQHDFSHDKIRAVVYHA
ncbi:MAG: AAA family ATPase, partial [Chloroflexota bacterium]|nr:AAA family ATPase [Chloroflexota bacterium]